MYDIITFGSASRDIFLRVGQFLIGDFKYGQTGKGILLPFGLKVDINEIHFHSGGGGTNAAATFAAQGLRTAYCGVIGKDPEGEEVLRELKEKGINTEFVLRTDKKPTNVSIIFSTPQERTILAYKGASQVFTSKQIPWSKTKNTKWFYLAPFGEGLFKVFKDLISFAKNNQIKLMVNLGAPQLKLNSKILHPLLEKIDILLLNQEEAQMLIGDFSLKEEDLILKIKKFFPGVLIITNGEKEVFLAKENAIFSTWPSKIKIIDKTGAGDALGAGFLAGYIKNKGDMITATQLALANSVFCIKKWGAKEGILKKNQSFRKVKVIKKLL